ncbi:GNAT family N-acetyltransferase [Mesoterricola sediminis]|uniref:N-acetyltransferase domain-containing protein n=1 Tax=Mesoterricola sediminis TaxID=2927980 RepID=A0AA48GS31_9BACT|nr:GNAT family N-acetyltransferase [Mesoterricola sediminis]BDU75134.1 hypothetical protein METESE_00920 [Mesoterricola sediminis]
MDYLFYLREGPGAAPGPETGLEVEVWRPTLLRPLRAGLPLLPFAAWSAFHFARVFATRDYRVLLLAGPEGPVHRTCLLPAHFRFPFMVPGDLQAAALWTRGDLRGRGIALAGLRAALATVGEHRVWYMVREDNLPSIRLAEKAGFAFHARGGRRRGALAGLLDRFELQA